MVLCLVYQTQFCASELDVRCVYVWDAPTHTRTTPTRFWVWTANLEPPTIDTGRTLKPLSHPFPGPCMQSLLLPSSLARGTAHDRILGETRLKPLPEQRRQAAVRFPVTCTLFRNQVPMSPGTRRARGGAAPVTLNLRTDVSPRDEVC